MSDPMQPVEVVLVTDPNLSPAMDTTAYRESYDPAMIVDKDKACPAVRFVLAPIPRRHLLAIDMAHPSMVKRWEGALVASLREVRFPGRTLKPEGVHTLRPDPNKPDVWHSASDEWFDVIADEFGQEAAYEIGRAAYTRARLPKRGAFPLASR